jgi:osmotically-inducible protein OsmY
VTVESKRRGPVPASIWLLLLAWIGLTAATVIWGLPHMEDHLAGRGEAALADQRVGVRFVGRDARLTGQVADPSEIARAVATIRQLPGVRRVVADGIVINPDEAGSTPAAALQPPDLTLTFDAGVVTISGTMPNRATADAIGDAARARWASEQVIDLIGVGSNTSGAAWLAGIVTAVSSVDSLSEGSIIIGPAGVLVHGSVPTDETVASVQESLMAAFGPEIPVESRLEVVALVEPGFVAELLAAGTVRLGGVMPDQVVIDAIVAAAIGVYGSGSVVSEMSVDATTASPPYLAWPLARWRWRRPGVGSESSSKVPAWSSTIRPRWTRPPWQRCSPIY